MTTTGFTFATQEDLKKLTLTRKVQSYGYSHDSNLHNVVETDNNPFDLDNLHLPAHLKVRGSVITEKDYSYYCQYNYNHGPQYAIKDNLRDSMRKLPYFVQVLHDGRDVKGKNFKTNETIQQLAATGKDPFFLGKPDSDYNYYYHHRVTIGNANVCVTVTYFDHTFIMAMPFDVAERIFDLTITDDLQLKLGNGALGDFSDHKEILTNLRAYRPGNYRDIVDTFDFTYTTLQAVETLIGMNRKNLGCLLKALVKQGWTASDPGMLSGIKKTWTRLMPVMKEVMVENPLAFCSYRSIAESCARSIDGVKISVVFNEVFEKVENKEQFLKVLKVFYTGKDDGDLYKAGNSDLEERIKKLDVYKEKRKAVLKTQANRAFAKIQQEAENLAIDKKKHKLTWAKIESGELALGVFFRKSEQYFLLNDNWDLWEEMFKQGYGEQAIELANEVKGRTTYEKDLMSYFYFVLHGLPDFLKKHTGSKWKCIPKLVNSADELEPPKEGSDGIARKRSALTPHVDNDAKTVTVPYASLAISGSFGTTYCYSHDYHVLTKGFSFNGYAVTSEIEKDLNGRDDYGLMFYTLTGSPQGRGYPSFLIIFERRESKGDTRVHFHRTHPFRSKDGDYNPIHQWIKTGFNWIMGNVNRDLLKAQQGDLFFIDVLNNSDKLDFNHKVNQYDNHKFETEVSFAEYTKAAKSNILGYVKLEKETLLTHNEHDNVMIPAGTYAIHQCRSWEANPKGVWSLRID